jgi:predicted nucleic acid-binding protein
VKIVIDSYAWIELFKGSTAGNKVKEIMEKAEALYTPDTVLAEVARKYYREGTEERTITARLELISANSSIINLDSVLAYESAICYSVLSEQARKAKLNTPSLFDAIILATAQVLKAKILTGDQHFKSLPETVWIQL